MPSSYSSLLPLSNLVPSRSGRHTARIARGEAARVLCRSGTVATDGLRSRSPDVGSPSVAMLPTMLENDRKQAGFSVGKLAGESA
jgi:hypothetical protein